MSLNFERAIAEGSDIFKKNSWYGNLIYLGEKRNYSVFTFTNFETINISNRPSNNYLSTITRGLQETYNLQPSEIVDYLLRKRGIFDNIEKSELEVIVKEKGY